MEMAPTARKAFWERQDADNRALWLVINKIINFKAKYHQRQQFKNSEKFTVGRAPYDLIGIGAIWDNFAYWLRNKFSKVFFHCKIGFLYFYYFFGNVPTNAKYPNKLINFYPSLRWRAYT